MIPAKADPEQQAVYLHQELEPRLAEAQAGQRAVFFVDAAHFVLAPFLGFLWSLVRVFIPAPAGRQRFNVLGALNAVTHELITVTNDTYLTAESVCALLHKLADLHLSVPITLVLDNARYQKCAVVFATAASLQIELCFLPAYSPNLNLIEIGYTQYSSGRMRQGTRLPTWQQVIGSMGRPGIRQVTSPPAIPTGGLAACAGLRGVRF
jgi:hypothetical protein